MSEKFKLTMEYIESLIEEVSYNSIGCATTCYLKVGSSMVLGTSYVFDMSENDPARGRQLAYNKAITQLFELEAYHIKRAMDSSEDFIKLLSTEKGE